MIFDLSQVSSLIIPKTKPPNNRSQNHRIQHMRIHLVAMVRVFTHHIILLISLMFVSKYFMVHSVVDSLVKFSIAHDLWQTTINYGITCLENWIKQNSDEHNQLFPQSKADSFLFDKVNQQLIFFQHDKMTFIIRTKYSLFTDKQKDKDVPVGWYALDVDQDGEFVDDWLYFD